MSEPLISVFLPTHARFKSGLLSKSVESVLAQSYRNFELLIVDDASADGAAAYIGDLAKKDGRVKHMRFEKNVGLPARTLAHAYLQSKGELLAFAFDDTEWFPNHLRLLADCLENNPDAGMAYGGVSIEVPGGETFILGEKNFDLPRLVEYNYIGNCGVMIRRSTVENVGWYDPHILVKRCCDWDLWLRIGKKKIQTVRCNSVIAHENGALQNDSIGMSVSLYDDLTRKYLATERDHLLQPSSIVSDKASMFNSYDWMSREEVKQLRILTFEHYLRTSDIGNAVDLAKEWLVEQNQTDVRTGNNEIDALAAAFNLYLAETRYSCKRTCESAYKLSGVLSAYNTLQVCYGHLENYQNKLSDSFYDMVNKYSQIDSQHNMLMRSFSWRLTKPLRELKRICRSNKYIYQVGKSLVRPLRRMKVGR